jgi:hypothetical protein
LIEVDFPISTSHWELFKLAKSKDGQARLVRLLRVIRLQTGNFQLYLRQQTDKRQTSVCRMSKR